MASTQLTWFQRLTIWAASTRFGGWVVLNLTTRLDPLLMRLSNGRVGTGVLTGREMMLLTTTGAKSGKPRTVPLIYFRDGDSLVVIASATGIARHPGWYHNLKAHPEARVFGRGVSGTYTAREASGDERERLWRDVVRQYPGYEVYRRRARDRVIPVMVLEPN